MATTIYSYLHNDDLNGSRIVSMDDCMCKLYYIKRNDLDFLSNFNKDLQKPALYVLLSKENRKAYIGETDNFYKRIIQHIANKDFWNEVMVFLGSNDDILSKTEVKFLECLAFSKAKYVESYDLSENTQKPKQPYMNIMLEAKTNKFFEYVQFLSKFVGCDIFESHNSVPESFVKDEPPIPMNIIENKSLSQSNKVENEILPQYMSNKFREWAEVYFCPNGENVDILCCREDAFISFQTTSHVNYWTPTKFGKALKEFCLQSEWITELNPVELCNTKDRRILKHVKQTNGKTLCKEFFYVRTQNKPINVSILTNKNANNGNVNRT